MPVTVRNAQASFSITEHTVPALIPQAAETLINTDAYLDALVLTPGVSADTVTVKDKQGPPTIVFGPYQLLPGEVVVAVPMGGRYCPGGITWESTTGGVVTGYAKWSR